MFGRRISWRALVAWGVAVAAVAALAIVGLAGSKGGVGRPAPALPSDRLSGAPVTLASLRGRPALVVFWASWCTPCEQEAPALERFWRRTLDRPHAGKPAGTQTVGQPAAGTAKGGTSGELVGVNWSDPSLSNARAFIRRFGWTFPNLRDSEELSGQRYGVSGLPTTFAIDARGRIRATLRGPQTEASLRRALAAASA